MQGCLRRQTLETSESQSHYQDPTQQTLTDDNIPGLLKYKKQSRKLLKRTFVMHESFVTPCLC